MQRLRACHVLRLRPTLTTPAGYRYASALASLIDCSKVVARKDKYGGVGAFARVDFKKGDVVEHGIVRRLPVDGNTCPYVFTWSEDRTVWASGSGCSVFYNASLDGSNNTEMARSFDDDSFTIHASRDIRRGEELTHLYKSIDWRECFKDLKKLRDSGAGNPSSTASTEAATGNVASGSELIDCSKVYAKKDSYGGVGAYAAVPIKKGELVEKGIVRRLPVDGNLCPFVFTWSEDRSVWASGSGCSVFYNASIDGSENTEMKRFFDDDSFEIYATRDIAQHEELTHLYKSIEWRECFKDLKELRDSTQAGTAGGSDRAKFQEYWAKDHGAPTLENMMLDSNAGSMDALERPEILSKLPSLQGKVVLDLGAGIGRFSGILAEKADEVVAVDFVEASCAENRRANADKSNLKVLQADVTTLQFEPNSFDMIFSNWLLMYLSDEEVEAYAKNVLSWLRPGGILFCRESCFHSSGNHARRFNPTRYRDPETYTQIFSDATLTDGCRFQLQATNCVESYAKVKGNMFQMWFRWQKLGLTASERRRRTLAIGQHTPAKALRYEKIYGHGYIFTGGDAVSQKMLEACQESLAPGARVLDLGAGLGGTAFYLAENLPGVYVHAVNVSSEMGSIVSGRHLNSSKDIRNRVSFDIAPEYGLPEHELRYPANCFDVVFIRETMMYLEPQDKAVLMQKIWPMLRPGGRVVVVDYCVARPASELSADLRSYFERWAYYPILPEAQEALMGRYFSVETRDLTDDFVGFMDEGLQRIEEEFGPNAPAMKVAFGQAELDALRTPLRDLVNQQLFCSSDAAEGAAQAAVESLSLHVAAAEADVDRCKADYKSLSDIWQFERKVSAEGDLKWCMFVATKEHPAV
eukprot:TRINITY_DN18891_c0_g2_i1.p1 TRINITY_DN18891_c0_g2~~TRINITY_DN18891_c0_g2_i1.p1  ORF type:complete len:866 (+),score=175.07 TRINITY_DN18891_c0_g2_i1:1342-3939(+)